MRGALWALVLAGAAGCVGPRLALVREGLAGCPDALTDAVVDDLGSYQACTVPDEVTALVRADEADEELDPADLGGLAAAAQGVPAEAFARQLDTFVNPDRSLAPWIRFEPDTGRLWPDPVLAPEAVVTLSRAPHPGSGCEGCLQPPLDAATPYRPRRRAELAALATAQRPLQGLRVVLDPGHFGGAWARFERRHFELPGPDGPQVVEEGELTLRTALELRARLVALGAEVHLTREAPGPLVQRPLTDFRPAAARLLRRIALEPAFAALDARLAPPEQRHLRVALGLWAIRKQFVFEDLRARARAAQALHPDVLISLHYNAGAWPTGTAHPQTLVAMVEGNVEAHRVFNPAWRADALSAALAVDDFNAAAHLAARCLEGMSAALGVPIDRAPHYADHRPIRRPDGTASGVDAWNGVLLRYARGLPALLVEGPYMNERDEAPRLAATQRAPLFIPGTRSEAYAQGVADGLVAWTRRWLAQRRNDFDARL